MKNELDNKFVLSVFDKICKHGEKQGEEHILEGVKAFTDLDGYTIFLEDAQVKLRFGFHNQYHFDYEKSEHLEKFQMKLISIEKGYS
ncbi:DUF3081 domain-containing protein [Aestuariibacter sp. AA17]|uniref:DUF3081 domain-containing protein n=1 Tax=Fluctibacter corallii TaxID=2984329 RepID=A0ABT3A350_9ALTE|nr:DUF3081 domain-containing protein [Aestuariibacter sp. AA17]MCV2883113.1 DUF3081 domain-containing protein [Aestuariibacter sp. AA17]